jgi:hypothetical protein
LPTPEDTAAPAQTAPAAEGNAFAGHDPRAWDYLLEPPDFSQMDVVAVPAAEPDKSTSAEPVEPGSKN